MDNKYDRIDVDFSGHQELGDESYSEDISYKIDECISDKIKWVKHELEYYKLFEECLKDYTQFEITQARLLNENIERLECDIEAGEKHLHGENTGTHGKDCSTQLDSLNKQLDRLLNIWKDIPFQLKRLIQFNLFEL
jgi:hypothetical protein